MEKAEQGAATPESAEVRAAPKAAASKKYSDAEKAAAKSAEQLRGKARSCGPVQVQRAQRAMKAAKATPESIVKAFKSMKEATRYAGGDKDIKQPDLVKQVGGEDRGPVRARARAGRDRAGAGAVALSAPQHR